MRTFIGEYIPQMVYGNLVQAEDNDCCEYVYHHRPNPRVTRGEIRHRTNLP